MNIDKNKILKMLVTLTAICLLVGSLTMLLGGNSMTLSEYAAQQGIDTKEQTAQNDSLDAKEEASESDSLASEDSAAQSSLDETTENLQTEAEDTAASQLPSDQKQQNKIQQHLHHRPEHGIGGPLQLGPLQGPFE